MKKTKLLLLILSLTLVFALSSCEFLDSFHACEDACPICGKCLETDCNMAGCKDKCQGHQPTEHACENVCSECGKCLDAECSESACADKCQGHKTPDEEPEHVCAESLTKTDAVAATCVADGCAEYYTCSCGKIYSDAEAKNETTLEDSIIPALGHDEQSHDAKAPTCTEGGYDAYVTCSRCDYTTYAEKAALGHDEQSHEAKAPTCTEGGYDAYVTCSRCDYTTYAGKEALGHDYEWVVDSQPTFSTTGVKHEECTRCNDKRNENTEIPVKECNHELIKTNAVQATCLTAGNKAYYTCSICAKIYSNEEGTLETTVENSVTQALGHDEQKHNAKAPTCTEKGHDAYVTCSRCDYTTYAEKAALGHDEQKHNAKAPTCTEKGHDAYVTCSRCDYTTYAEKAALGHDEQKHNAKAPTCTEKGHDAYVTCSRCDYTTYKAIPETGHDYKATVTAPTCEAQGYTTHVCQNDATHTYTDSYVDPLGHSYGEWTLLTSPTYEVEGTLSRACAKCSDTDEKNIGTVSEANGYSLVIGGVVSRWQFTDGDFSITLDLENKDAVTNTYSDDASAWYVGFDASGAMIKIDGYKTTNAPWDGTNLSFGDSGMTYYTTVTSPKATTVTLIINCARNKAKPFFTANTEHCIDNLMVNGSADGVICFADAQLSVTGWHAYTDYAIATLFLQEGDNVISFKSATTVNFKGIGYVSTEELHIHSDEYIEATKPNCTEAGLSYGIACSTCNKVILAQETVDALGHTNAWTHTMTTKPTYEAEGLIESVEACTVCGVVNATNSFTVPTVNANTEGYELLVTGVASRWQYTYDNAEFIIELMETDVNTNTYSFGVEAWYSDRNGTGTPIGSEGFKHTTAVWNAAYSCYGQSNRVYTTTIVVDKPTAVTLTITAARNKAKPYFSETGAEHVLDWIKVNGSESNVIYNMDAQLSSTSWYGWKTAGVATLFLEEGVNVISFDTSTNTNFQGIGFLSTEEIKLAEDKVDLDLMSFNIRQDTDSGAKAWANRKDALINLIIDANPSVICFQEVKQHQYNDLAAGLTEYTVLYYGRGGSTTEGLAIAYKSAEWNEISRQRFWLSETPDVESKGWGASYLRICVNVLLQHKATNQYLNVFTVHLDFSETPKQKGMELIVQKAREMNEAAGIEYPTLIAGDYNDGIGGVGYNATLDMCNDVRFSASVSDFYTTGSQWGAASDTSTETIIDHIFVSRKHFASNVFEVIRTRDESGFYPSDHFAVMAKVALLVPHSHKEVIDEAVAADCTNTGLTEGKHCSSCGEVLVAQDVTEILGHIYTDNTDVECDRCGFVRDITCAHANKVAVSAKDATCTEAGNTAGEMCSDCGELLVDEIFPALGHSYTEWSCTTQPTYEVEGQLSKSCTVCSDTVTHNMGTLSAENGYTLVITGVLSRWQYTYEGTTYTFDIKENVKVTDYLYECDAFYVSYIDGVMTTQNGYKTTNNTDFNGSRFGTGTNKTYTTTITVAEATTVTLYVELARTSSTRYYSNTISSVSVNGKTADVIPTEDSFVFKGWSSFKYYAVATIFLDAGTNVVHFKTITNANTAGIGFGSTIPIHMHKDVIDPAVAATCDTPGKTQGIHCSECNEVIIAQEEIPNHTEWEVKEQPTFDAAGTLERSCTVCGEAETAILPIISEENGYTIFEANGDFYKAEYTYEGKTFLLENLFRVTFDYNGAAEAVTETVYGNVAPQPTTPSYSYTDYAGKQYNFVFAGWYLDGALYDFNTILTSDITLVARWELPEEFFAFEENADVRASGTDLRIMSFNVLADDWNDKPAVAPRVEHFVNTLNRYLPDVACLQEFDDQWYEAFMALTDFKYKLVTVDGNGKVLVNESTNYVTIAYNTETVELIEFEQGKLPTGSNKSVRNVTSAIFNIKATNERCIVMSVHFNTSESQKENNGREILDFISDLKTRYPDYPILLAGDFNSREGSVAYNTIINGSGFTDTKTADKLGLVMDTYHKGNGFDSTTTLNRDSIYPKHVMTTDSIDHIFTDNNIQVLYFDTVCDDDALKASDHLPTYCDVSFKNEQPKSYTYNVEEGLFASVTDGGAYAEGTVVGINTNKYGTFYEHTKGATFTLNVVVTEDTEATFIIKGSSTNGYSFKYSDVIKSLTLNGEAVETNDYTLKTFGWYAERANGIVIAKLSLKAGSNTISFTMGTETAKDINIAAVTFISDSLVSIAKD